MRLLSSFLLWLMMLAIPVQGFASASMLYCAGGAEHHGMQMRVMPGSHHMDGPAVHMEHGVGATDGGVGVVGKQSDQVHAMSGKFPNSPTKCSVCATCCNIVGIAQALSPMAPAIFPSAQYLEPLVQSYAAPSRLLERPPRS